jgi:cardiolipin synthase (CMP-forming)
MWIAAGLVWVLFGGAPWVLGWSIAVACSGLFVPGLANQVTLARAYLAAPALAYGVAGQFGALAVVVAIAGLTDLADGTIARRFGSPSQFGGALDPVVDGLFMCGLAFGAALGGAFPVWLGAVAVARYVVPALAGGVLLAAGRRPDLRHTLTGQVSTVLILVLLGGACLLRGLGQDASRLVAGAEVVIPLAAVATWVHLAWAALRRPARVAEAG